MMVNSAKYGNGYMIRRDMLRVASKSSESLAESRKSYLLRGLVDERTKNRDRNTVQTQREVQKPRKLSMLEIRNLR